MTHSQIIIWCISIAVLVVATFFFVREKWIDKNRALQFKKNINKLDTNLIHYTYQVEHLERDLLDFEKFDQDKRIASIVAASMVASSIGELLDKLDNAMSESYIDKNTLNMLWLMRMENKLFYLKLSAHRLHGEMSAKIQ